jgi:hypothetical protein
VRRRIALALAGGLTLLSGCQILRGPDVPETRDTCGWTTEEREQDDPAQPRVAVLIDRSGSVTPATATAPDYGQGLRDELRAAIGDESRVAVAGFDSAVASFPYEGINVRPTTRNARNRQAQRDDAKGCLDRAVAGAAGSGSASGAVRRRGCARAPGRSGSCWRPTGCRPPAAPT